MSRFFRKTNASEIVKKLVVKTICERSLINEGDRILIAVSGGKDSSVLSWALSAVKPAFPPTFAPVVKRRFFAKDWKNGEFRLQIYLSL